MLTDLLADYAVPATRYDELLAGAGVPRAHWDAFLRGLASRASLEIGDTLSLMEREIRENGITYRTDEVDDVIERTEGVSAAFLKELCRRAALIAAETSEPSEALVVRHHHLVAALDDLLEHSTPILRSTLGASPEQATPEYFGSAPAMMQMMPASVLMTYSFMHCKPL